MATKPRLDWSAILAEASKFVLLRRSSLGEAS